jgi:hypothetical protein
MLCVDSAQLCARTVFRSITKWTCLGEASLLVHSSASLSPFSTPKSPMQGEFDGAHCHSQWYKPSHKQRIYPLIGATTTELAIEVLETLRTW